MISYRNLLGLFAFTVTMSIVLIFPSGEIYASEQIKWKTFKEKNGLFTIKYPATWHASNETNFGATTSLFLSPDQGCYYNCDTNFGVQFFNYDGNG